MDVENIAEFCKGSFYHGKIWDVKGEIIFSLVVGKIALQCTQKPMAL